MRLSYLLSITSLLAVGFLLSASMGPDTWREKVDPSLLPQLDGGQRVEMLVVLHEQADLTPARHIHGKAAKGTWVYARVSELAQRTQAPIVAILAQNNTPYRAFRIVNAIFTRADLALARELASHPAVKSLQPNPWSEMQRPVADELENTGRVLIEWGIERINADDVWALGYNGQGVVVGGQDTGYEWAHPAIKSQYRGWDGTEANHNYHWHDAIHVISPLHGDTTLNPANNPCGLNINAPCDDNNHGTHTMGTMVGDDGQGNQIGVAPGARWVGVRNMERGWGSPATYIEGFEWFLAPTNVDGENPQPLMAPHVINNSWGCPPVEGCNEGNWEVMNQVVNTLRAAGIVVVVSAGNSGSSCSSVSDPAAIFDGSFTVGATRFNDTIAGYSSRGPVLVDGSLRLKPDVAAPGSNVRSCIRGDQYANFSGTSMAGPHVAGAVALLISAVPDLAGEVDSIEAILKRTAVRKYTDQDCGDYPGQQSPNAVYGHGRIDVLAAVEEAQRNITGIEPTPFTPNGVNVYPNPANEWVLFIWQDNHHWETLELYSLDGRRLQAHAIAGRLVYDLSLQALPAGVYVYRLSGAGQVLSGKLTKS